MEPTDETLIVGMAVLAILLPVGAVWLWHRQPRHTAGAWRRAGRFAVQFGVVVLCQVVAVAAVFLYVNRSYGFYSSWNDVLGQDLTQPEPVRANGLDAGSGRIETLTVKGEAAKVTGSVIVWLPPQYSQPAYAKKSFPVVIFLPGQPSSPQIVYDEFTFGAQASAAIASGKVAPFVAVFPPIMINPPRDTECTNVPNGPQAESWLTKDVTDAVTKAYRVEPSGPHWAAMGWSTGGLCAAKLMMRHPKAFGGAVSFGGDVLAYEDNTTGKLFGGSAQLKRENSPLDLYLDNAGTQGGKLMLVAGKQDKEVWGSVSKMLPVVQGDPNVSVVTFAQGGHNDARYAAFLPTAFTWMHSAGVLK
jgi:enterochelin esterase-like enzyme